MFKRWLGLLSSAILVFGSGNAVFAADNYPADPSPSPMPVISCPTPTYRLYHTVDASDQPAVLSDSFPNLGDDWNDKVGSLYVYPGAEIEIYEGALVPGDNDGFFELRSHWELTVTANERGLLVTPLVFPDWMTSTTWDVMQGVNLFGGYGASAVLIRKCQDLNLLTPSLNP